MMKFSFFFYQFLFAHLLGGAFDEPYWNRSLEEAWETAKQQNKDMLVYVSSKSCKPCKRMEEEVFSSVEFKEYAKNVVLVKISDDRDDKYYKKTIEYLNVSSFPSYFLYKPNGESFGFTGGLYSIPQFLLILNRIQ